MAIAVPVITNLALGLELLLTVHHFQVTGKYPRGHNVGVLGRSFPESTLAVLRENYCMIYDNETISKGLEFRVSGGSRTTGVSAAGQPLDFSTYDLAIAYVGPMYVKWRYVYEEWNEEVDIRASFAPSYFVGLAVHKAIRNQSGKTKITLKEGLAP